MPPTPDPGHSAVPIGNDVAVAEAHELTYSDNIHSFSSLEELRRTAVAEIAASRQKFQTLPPSLRPHKMSCSDAGGVRTPQSPKKARTTAPAASREDGAYETTGLRGDDPFIRAKPRKTQGALEIPRARVEAAPVVEEANEEDALEDLSPASINEALVVSFMREQRERCQTYPGEQEWTISQGVTVTLNPFPTPTFSADELLGSISNGAITQSPKS
ncbi:hypothetical protein FOMPIDRAFT_1016187 [Fomitopsis schrenkii]|uniref:Uncharacterized protein n=1 Tax=Fomitopsis schrenkii TaxID=2126942 RepID=S8FHW7_FOMSC|nr:hypothetical protein FOMPIDRAFT_1016187 [Fomitopsis schrenkii]